MDEINAGYERFNEFQVFIKAWSLGLSYKLKCLCYMFFCHFLSCAEPWEDFKFYELAFRIKWSGFGSFFLLPIYVDGIFGSRYG
jgi:hypothetical protein